MWGGRDRAELELLATLLDSLSARMGDGPALLWSREDDEEPYWLDLVRKCSRLPAEERG